MLYYFYSLNFLSKDGVFVSLRYKIDVLSCLNDVGYSTYRLRKEKILGEAIIQKLRTGKIVSASSLETICRLLSLQPGDILEYTED